MTTATRRSLERRARLLEYATTTWNTLEAAVAVTTGLAAHSLGLVAFGLDSCVEVFGSLVVLWQLRGNEHDSRTARAMQMLAGAFAVLAVYLTIDGVHGLVARAEPRRSWFGLAFLAATVVVMVLLATLKRATGKRLGNDALIANARMTLLDSGLATGILVAVFLAVSVHWWWADAVAALGVAVLAGYEAVASWREAG